MTNHNLVGRIDGKRVLVRTFPDWNQAIVEHARMSAALREGRLVRLSALRRSVGEEAVTVTSPDYLAVREAGDPQWQDLPRVQLVVRRAGKGARNLDGPVKRWAKEQGFVGAVGGWIHRAGPNGQPTGRAIMQGWWAFAKHRMPARSLLFIDHRYHLAEKEA